MNYNTKILFLITVYLCGSTHVFTGAQENLTPRCASHKDNCDEFKKCCDKACSSGATIICHAASATQTHKAGETGFMAGAEHEEASATTVEPDAQCLCPDPGLAVIPMTNACLGKLNAPDRCTAFEACCEEACFKNEAYAHTCKQNPDGSSTADTECLCFNTLTDIPGLSESSKGKKGDEAHVDKVQYEDFGPECMNRTETCKAYEDCCIEMCKKVEHSGTELPSKMCVGNKNGLPMKSTHTFCLCPKTSMVFGGAIWKDGSKGEGVSQVFKGGSDYDDGIGNLSPASKGVLIFVAFVCYVVSGL